MVIDTHEIKRWTFMSVKSGDDPSKYSVPKVDTKSLKLFKAGIDLDHPEGLIGMDKADIRKQIELKGYAIHGVEINFTIREGG